MLLLTHHPAACPLPGAEVPSRRVGLRSLPAGNPQQPASPPLRAFLIGIASLLEIDLTRSQQTRKHFLIGTIRPTLTSAPHRARHQASHTAPFLFDTNESHEIFVLMKTKEKRVSIRYKFAVRGTGNLACALWFSLASAPAHSAPADYSSSSAWAFSRRSITAMSSRVVVSPVTAPLVASSRSRRRMILPLRVLGNKCVKRTSEGRAMEPIVLATNSINSLRSSLLGSWPTRSATKQTIASPLISSGRATTAASATAGWLTSTLSISMELRR